MKIIRSLFLSFLLILVLLLSGCSSDEKLLTDSYDYAFLDHQPAAAIITHSYEKFIKNSFSVLASFFSKSDASGIKNKLFGNIKNQLKIDLLNAEKLSEYGFSIKKPVLAAVFKNGLYLSIPVKSSLKAEQFFKQFPESILQIIKPDSAKNNKKSLKQKINTKITRVLITKKRVFILSGIISSKKKLSEGFKKWIASSGKKASLLNLWLNKDSKTLINLPFIPRITYPVESSINILKSRIDITLTSKVLHDPLASFIFKLLSKQKINPYKYIRSYSGKGLSEFAKKPGLLSFVMSLNFADLWKNEIKPRILKQANRNLGKIGGLLSTLLGGKKSIFERMLDGLEIEKEVISGMTGRIALKIDKLSNFSLLSHKINFFESIKGLVLLEMKSKDYAASILNHIYKHLSRFRIPFKRVRLPKNTYYTFSLIRCGIPGFLFFKPYKEYILISPRLSSVLDYEKTKGRSLYYTSGQHVYSVLKPYPVKYYASLSVNKLYKNIASSFDNITRQNISPFTQLINIVNRISLCYFYKNTKHAIRFSLILNKPITNYDPFSGEASSYDLVLLFLTSFFAMLILAGIARYLYKKVKYRN